MLTSSLTAAALALTLSPVPVLQGEYQLHPEPFIVSQTLRETVPLQSAQGRKRRDALVNEGYRCESTPLGMARCALRVKEPTLSQKTLDQLAEKYADSETLHFDAPTEEAELVHQSPSYKEWRTRQTVLYAGKTYDETFYFSGSSGIHKVRLGKEEEGLEFHLDPQQTGILARMIVTTEPGASWRLWTEYTLLLMYSSSQQ